MDASQRSAGPAATSGRPVDGPYAEPQPSPLRRGYFVRNRWANALFVGVDTLLRWLASAKRAAPTAACQDPSRILLANGAHLGDIVLSMSILESLKAAYPRASIGMLVGSWSRMVVEGHPLLDRIHVVDHWRLNRSNRPLLSKLAQYWRSRRQALASLKAARYDMAIDLYFYVPNSALLLWQARIPRRVGYRSAGFGPLYTQSLEWRLGRGSISNYFLDLLRAAFPGVAAEAFQAVAPRLDRGIARPACVGAVPYAVLHVGTGGATKEWPLDRWRALAAELDARGVRTVFTGAGEVEQQKIAAVTTGLSHASNLCGRLAWTELVATIRDARLLIGLDSVAGHIAAAFDVPSIILSNGVQEPSLWKPLSKVSTVVRHEVSCQPCYRSRGCAAMACIRRIEPAQVIALAQSDDSCAPGS